MSDTMRILRICKVATLPQWITSSHRAAYQSSTRTIWLTRWRYLPHELCHWIADMLGIKWFHTLLDRVR